jgi:hypothetical protein
MNKRTDYSNFIDIGIKPGLHPLCSLFCTGISVSVLLSCIFTPMAIWAQSVSGYQHNALAGAAVALSALPFSVSQNPAGISGGTVSWYGMRYFGLADLDETGVFVSFPHARRDGGIGLLIGSAVEVHHFGFDLYREFRVSAGTALKFGNMKLGFAPGFRHTGILNYGSMKEVYFSAGFIYQFSDYWNIGGYFGEVGVFEWGELQPGAQSSLGTGLVYNRDNRLQWLGAGKLETGYPPSVATALRLWLIDNTHIGSFWIGAGYTTMNDSWSGGFQYRYRNISAGFTLVQHPRLGGSHGVGFDSIWSKGS